MSGFTLDYTGLDIGERQFTYPSCDGTVDVSAWIWTPAPAEDGTPAQPVGIVQIVHGMLEHIGRYDDMARTLAYTPQLDDVARAHSQAAQLRLEALCWEGELIEEQLDAGRIDESTAKAMRRTLEVIRFDAADMI